MDKEELFAFFDSYAEDDKNICDEAKEECKKTIKALGKKFYPLSLEFPKSIFFLTAEGLLTLEESDQYLIDISWIDYPAVLSKLVEYKRNPPKNQKEISDNKKAAAAIDPKKIWATKKNADGTLLIDSYKGTEEVVVVPEIIGKAKVTGIAPFAFSSERSRLQKEQKEARLKIKEIVLPESIENIESDAFSSCKALNVINLPKNLKNLGARAFMNCTALTKIELPKNLKNIGESVFSCCSNLEKLEIPGSVKNIPNSLASNSGIKALVLEEGIEAIGTIDEKNLWKNNESFARCFNLTEVKLPHSLKTIGSGAFSSCISLSKIDLPLGLEKIERYAFAYNSQIKEFKWPETVKIIETNVLAGTAIEKMDIPEGVAAINSCAFSNCKNLISIKLPKGLTELGYSVFNNCFNLKEVEISEGLKKIEHTCFNKCSSLEKLYLPSSIKQIDEDTFIDSENLRIYAPKGSFALSYAQKNNIAWDYL